MPVAVDGVNKALFQWHWGGLYSWISNKISLVKEVWPGVYLPKFDYATLE